MKQSARSAVGLLKRLGDRLQPHHPRHVSELFSNLSHIGSNIDGANAVQS